MSDEIKQLPARPLFPESGFIDFDHFDAIGFDLVFADSQYNLQLVFIQLDEMDQFENGMFLRTTIFEDSVDLISPHISMLFSMGLFQHLHFMGSGHILSVEGDIIGEVDWETMDVISANLYKESTLH